MDEESKDAWCGAPKPSEAGHLRSAILYPTTVLETKCRESPVHNQVGVQMILCNTYRIQRYNSLVAPQLIHNRMGLQMTSCNTYRIQRYNAWVAPKLIHNRMGLQTVLCNTCWIHRYNRWVVPQWSYLYRITSHGVESKEGAGG